MSKDRHRGKRGQDDPIGDYVEWTENRYNPGYYTGGRIPPWIRNWGSGSAERDYRILAALLLAVAAALFYVFWNAAGPVTGVGRVVTAAVSGLLAVLALLAFRASRRP